MGGGLAVAACLRGVHLSTMLDRCSTLSMIGWRRLVRAMNIIVIMLLSVSSIDWPGVNVGGRGVKSSIISLPGACIDVPKVQVGTEEIMGADPIGGA